MIMTTLDLVTAIAAFVLLPLIIGANVFNRQGGVMGYLWRENPYLVRLGLVFLFMTWLVSASELAAYYGLILNDLDRVLTVALGIPMFVLSLAILAMSTMEGFKYLRMRRSA